MADRPPRCVLVGAGPMGLATARAVLAGPVDQRMRLLLVDRDRDRLEHAVRALAASPDPPARDLVEIHHGELDDPATRDAVAGCDVVAAALSWVDCRPLFALAARVPLRLAAIGRPPVAHRDEIAARPAPGGRLVVGVGLEPGLTEIVARRLVARTAGPAVVRVFCGGVPADPRPPLRHLSWYGTQLAITPRATYRITDGEVLPVPRFSGVELVDVPGLGTVEAFHDGLAPWIADDPVFATVHRMDQKTLRWPGYAGYAVALSALGLLDEIPVSTMDGPVRPRALLDAVLAPHITPRPGDTDVTVLACEVTGAAGTTVGNVIRADTDVATGTTGMGRLTGGALAATVRLLADDADLPTGLLYPYQLFTGPRADALFDRLRGAGVSIVDHAGPWVRPLGRGDDADEQPDE